MHAAKSPANIHHPKKYMPDVLYVQIQTNTSKDTQLVVTQMMTHVTELNNGIE